MRRASSPCAIVRRRRLTSRTRSGRDCCADPMASEDYPDSFYARMLRERRAYPALEGDLAVETLVIGGGLAGCATALDLAEHGHKVALVEARRIGWGASGRNGGFVSD